MNLRDVQSAALRLHEEKPDDPFPLIVLALIDVAQEARREVAAVYDQYPGVPFETKDDQLLRSLQCLDEETKTP